MSEPIYLSRFHRRGHLIGQYRRIRATRGAEIGVCTGLFSARVCAEVPTLQQLLCVDPWTAFNGNRPNGWGRDQAKHEANYAEAVARLSAFPAAQIVRLPSVAAAADVPDGSLDFVYLDGNHRFDFIMQDLIAWAPKVRSGGIVSGDDYYPFQGKGYVDRGVILAVDAYRDAHDVGAFYVTGSRGKSWWWVQP